MRQASRVPGVQCGMSKSQRPWTGVSVSALHVLPFAFRHHALGLAYMHESGWT